MTSSTYLASALTIGLSLSAIALSTALVTRATNGQNVAQNVGSGQVASGQTDYDAQVLKARTISGSL